MNALNTITTGMAVKEMEKILKETTIFDKIEFSKITKQEIKERIKEIAKSVKEREVLLNMTDRAVLLYWFKNWLHPALKHAIPAAPTDKLGCSKKVIQNDMNQDFLKFYENGQSNFEYTLEDIENYIK